MYSRHIFELHKHNEFEAHCSYQFLDIHNQKGVGRFQPLYHNRVKIDEEIERQCPDGNRYAIRKQLGLGEKAELGYCRQVTCHRFFIDVIVA